ncbi:MAG: putative aminohydrolase SsnA [Caldisericia bacterium]|jgi:putative selenium metabolism protein SsnA|nr:putative aminohydrolase SsnA [Caldisericia bacterium]
MKAIRNINIFTGGESPKFIKNGSIIFNDKIVKILEKDDDLKKFDVEIIDGKGKLLIPGMIISHDHLYSSLARGIGLKDSSPRNFYEILDKLWWKLDLALDRESVYYSALIGLIDAIKNGVTSIIDHHASFGYIKNSLDEIENAQNQIKIRVSTCFEVSDRWGEEKAKESIEENLRFIEKHKKRANKFIVPTFGLHALFTLSEETLKMCSEIVKEYQIPIHVHLSEDRFDRDYNIKFFGLSPVERLYKENMLNDKTLLIHCVHIDEKDRNLIKERNSIVIHNPESNMNNAVGLPDIFSLLKRGVLVGLGTDGFTHDMFRETQVLYIAHKHDKKDSNIGFFESYKLLFENNPKIVSSIFDEKVGEIKEGFVSDFVILDYTPPTPLNENNFFGHFIFGMSSKFVTHVFVNGELIVKDREILGIDEEKIFEESRKITQRLWERFESI